MHSGDSWAPSASAQTEGFVEQVGTYPTHQ
jgi:hypothetical protein